MPNPPCLRLPTLALALLIAACSTDGGRTTRPSPQAPAATQPTQRDAAASQWWQHVAAITAHADSSGRRAAVEKALAATGIVSTPMPFKAKEHAGSNLLAPVSGPATAPLLLLGAHLDQVAKGHGVTDNAAGCGVVLALAGTL